MPVCLLLAAAAAAAAASAAAGYGNVENVLANFGKSLFPAGSFFFSLPGVRLRDPFCNLTRCISALSFYASLPESAARGIGPRIKKRGAGDLPPRHAQNISRPFLFVKFLAAQFPKNGKVFFVTNRQLLPKAGPSKWIGPAFFGPGARIRPRLYQFFKQPIGTTNTPS